MHCPLPRSAAARSARGQAAIWLLGMLAASAAVMFALFNTSQTIVGKERAVNAADAAAMAGATTQARLLNLMAYTNRAVIANEVFLIQMLSMESWTQYVARTTNNIGYVVDVASVIFPALRGLAEGLHRAADAADRGSKALRNTVIPPMISALETAKRTMQGAHTAIRLGGGVLAELSAKSVVEANRSNFGGRKDDGAQIIDDDLVRPLTFAKNEVAWVRFTKLYARGERTDARQILLDSRDDFSASRPGSWMVNWMLPLAPTTFVGLEKGGGSQLVNFDRWETQDTLEFRTRWLGVCGRIIKYPCWKNDYAPIGWGRANADVGGSLGNVWSPRRTAQSNARSDGGRHNGWSGVPTQYDIADKSIANRATLGLDFLVAVGRPEGNDFSTTSLGVNRATDSVAGSSETPARLASARNTAFAKARVTFERPQKGLLKDLTAENLWRDDNAKEYGSLYSPYWQARLTDLSTWDKTSMLAAVGLTPDYVLYTPGGQTR